MTRRLLEQLLGALGVGTVRADQQPGPAAGELVTLLLQRHLPQQQIGTIVGR
jgi:hypothetical protein